MALIDLPSNIWLYEAGIGENRAALLHNGHIIEAHIERPGAARAGAIADAQLVKMLPGRRRAIIRMEDGLRDAILSSVPKDANEGGKLTAEITRAAIYERSRRKLPLARPSDKAPQKAASLLEYIESRSASDGADLRHCHAHEADHLAQALWHELMEQARSGIVSFPGGTLDIAITPAMVMIDIDGDLEPLALAMAAAPAIAGAIRRLGLQGSIGIDFPDVGTKSARNDVAQAFDAAMEIDCERTGINGFGFMQIVTKRSGPSLPELLQGARITGHALDLLRSAERMGGAGGICLHAHPAIIAKLKARDDLTGELARRMGHAVSLRAHGKIAICGGYAASETE